MASQDWFEKDFYAVLGVPVDADQATIKRTYRKRARKEHPDQNPGDTNAEKRVKDVGEAYAVLSDPEQRRQYDAIRQMARGGARFTAGGPGGGAGGTGFEDVFSQMFGGGGTRVRFDTGAEHLGEH
ncbi:DnaJ domain-containing protein, partial [Bradyrhizobium sp. NBAIM08]|uniref:DnaJ domain-containing protein n=1 Tax=Bradyrhizobium sp. NBAIM08 TaxID=2793815 RepID=UPI001CD4FE99